MKALGTCLIALAALLNHAVHAQSAFTIVGPEYKDVPGQVFEIPNMPRIRNQRPLGLCQAFAGATLLQKQYCDQEKISNCAQIPANEEISPLHVWSYISTNIAGQTKGERHNHRHISIDNLAGVFEENKGKIFSGAIILNMRKDGISLCSEANFSYDQFMSRFGQSEESVRAILSQLKRTYEAQKARLEAEPSNLCESCLKETAIVLSTVLSRPLTTDVDLRMVKRGLTRENFGEFLFESFFYKCDKISMKFPIFRYFPGIGESASKQQLKQKIAEVIKSGHPIAFNSLCVDKSAKDGCGTHEIIISGFKKTCTSSGKCIDQLKVHNSWGQSWQNQYTNSGWINADNLVNSFLAEPVTGQALVWLQNPN